MRPYIPKCVDWRPEEVGRQRAHTAWTSMVTGVHPLLVDECTATVTRLLLLVSHMPVLFCVA